MPGITNEHKMAPLFDQGLPQEAGVVSGFAPADILSPRTVENSARSRAVAIRSALDGVGGLGWSVIGFLVGAVFWHFVGFWGFVANVVLAGGPAAPASSAHPLHVGERMNWVRMADVSAIAPAACTALFLDRQTGLTSARACDGDHPPLPADSFQGREDRIVPSSGDPAALHDPGDRPTP
jgi:hypothetical protein